MIEREVEIKKRGQALCRNERRRSDTFITKSKITGREVVLNDAFADIMLKDNGYEHVPKIMGHFGGLNFDEDGNII